MHLSSYRQADTLYIRLCHALLTLSRPLKRHPARTQPTRSPIGNLVPCIADGLLRIRRIVSFVHPQNISNRFVHLPCYYCLRRFMSRYQVESVCAGLLRSYVSEKLLPDPFPILPRGRGEGTRVSNLARTHAAFLQFWRVA